MTAVRWMAGFTVVLVAALTGSAADQAKINDAISKGAEYLRKAHAPAQGYNGGSHGSGAAALTGMALLEAGTKTNDPTIQNITQLVRAYALGETKTYNIALMIVFLDRLGDPADVPFIQFMGARLYSGLNADGSWAYNCGSVLAAGEEARLRAAFQQGLPQRTNPKGDGKKGADGFPSTGGSAGKATDDPIAKVHPAVVPYFNAARNAQRQMGGDNSNTQFGMIGLWVSGRHGIPVEGAFGLIERRFVATQNRADFGWGYRENDKSSGSMTCAGLLALAFGQARKPAPAAPKSSEPNDPNDSFLNPKPKEKEKDEGAKGANKAGIDGALRAIGLVLQAGAARGWTDFVGYGNEYYLLWSIERVAMAYGLDTIGNADWHDIGSTYLIGAQQPSGAWSGAQQYGADVDTSFAILFLTRSNFVRDLSRKINHKDPGTSELRGGGDNKPPLYAPRVDHKGGGQDSPMTGGTTTPDPMVPTTPAPTTSGDALADGLVSAMGEDFATRLKHLRDAKGSEYTAALVRAIPKLDVPRQKQAREALAERLTRMTAATLRTMLKDKDEELRRGACLACAMKEDRAHLPDLIERITDSSDLVVRAARASLKSMSGKDFGPPAGADEATKAQAAKDWKAWYDTEGK